MLSRLAHCQNLAGLVGSLDECERAFILVTITGCFFIVTSYTPSFLDSLSFDRLGLW